MQYNKIQETVIVADGYELKRELKLFIDRRSTPQ